MTSVFGLYFQRQMQRNNNSLQKRGLRFGLDQARRNRETTEEQAPLIPRRAEEDFAARGVEDSTFQKTGVNRASNLASRMVEGARGRENLAAKALSTYKKNLKYQRYAYYAAIVSALINNAAAVSGAGGGSMGQQAQLPSGGGGGGYASVGAGDYTWGGGA